MVEMSASLLEDRRSRFHLFPYSRHIVDSIDGPLFVRGFCLLAINTFKTPDSTLSSLSFLRPSIEHRFLDIICAQSNSRSAVSSRQRCSAKRGCYRSLSSTETGIILENGRLSNKGFKHPLILLAFTCENSHEYYTILFTERASVMMSG